MGPIASGSGRAYWEPLEAALIRAVDELIGDGGITGDMVRSWNTSTHNRRMDVIFTVGAYETIASMMRSFDLDFDAEAFSAADDRRPDTPSMPPSAQERPCRHCHPTRPRNRRRDRRPDLTIAPKVFELLDGGAH